LLYKQQSSFSAFEDYFISKLFFKFSDIINYHTQLCNI